MTSPKISPHKAYCLINENHYQIDKRNRKKLENIVKEGGQASYFYARYTLNKRFIPGEPAIKRDEKNRFAIAYAKYFKIKDF